MSVVMDNSYLHFVLSVKELSKKAMTYNVVILVWTQGSAVVFWRWSELLGYRVHRFDSLVYTYTSIDKLSII